MATKRAKFYGIREGQKIKVSACNSGVSQKGFKWANFKYTSKSKDKESGRYFEQSRYEIWVANGVEIKNGDIIKIERINNIELKNYVKNNITYYICVLWANIQMDTEFVPQNEELVNNVETNENFDFDVDDGLDQLFE